MLKVVSSLRPLLGTISSKPSIQSVTTLPSWSWASYVGAVGWPGVITRPTECKNYLHVDQHFKLDAVVPPEHPEAELPIRSITRPVPSEAI